MPVLPAFTGGLLETHLKTELILAALEMALAQRRPEGVIHHSDRGCQYTSYAFGKRCQEMSESAPTRDGEPFMGACQDFCV